MISVRFSPRELQVLTELVKDGADNTTIARRLGYVSIDTAKTHIKNVYRKTGLSNRTALVVALYRLDIVPLDHYGRLADVGVR